MNVSINQTSPSLSFIDRITKEREEKDEKLASGKRINTAADDAAGLQIANRLTSQINGYQQLSVNSQDQINVNNVQSGQLASISDGLQRAKELSVQSGSPLNDSSAIQGELDQITEQINTIAGEALDDPNFLSGLDASDPNAAQAAINNAFETLNVTASSLGAETNALESQFATYETSRVNVSESRSRIEDTDFAETASEQQKLDTLLQATIITKKDSEARKGLLINQLI
ncbi:MAG: flagellin [Thalassotalea sp.]|nr:flagellin [Thalassotalea sp.]